MTAAGAKRWCCPSGCCHTHTPILPPRAGGSAPCGWRATHIRSWVPCPLDGLLAARAFATNRLSLSSGGRDVVPGIVHLAGRCPSLVIAARRDCDANARQHRGQPAKFGRGVVGACPQRARARCRCADRSRLERPETFGTPAARVRVGCRQASGSKPLASVRQADAAHNEIEATHTRARLLRASRQRPLPQPLQPSLMASRGPARAHAAVSSTTSRACRWCARLYSRPVLAPRPLR